MTGCLFTSFCPVVSKYLHLLKILEVLHPILGYTTGDTGCPTIEIGFCLLLMFIVIDSNEKVSGRLVPFNLFFIWSVTDLIRFSHYMLRIFEMDFFKTCFHYTTWFILSLSLSLFWNFYVSEYFWLLPPRESLLPIFSFLWLPFSRHCCCLPFFPHFA